jgi:predicted Ser/Thr protein kinase
MLVLLLLSERFMTIAPQLIPSPGSDSGSSPRTPVHRILEEEAGWDGVATAVLGGEAELVAVSRSVADSRIYRRGPRAAKIRARHPHLAGSLLPFERQAQSLRSAGIDAESSSRDSWDVLTMPWLEGRTLHNAAAGRGLGVRITLARQLLGTLSRLHRAGLAHGDLHPDNVIVTTDGVALLDFDRAVPGRGARLWLDEFRARSTPEPTSPLWRLLVGLLFPKVRRIRERLAGMRAARKPRARPPAHLAPDVAASEDLALLHRAWHLAKLSNESGDSVAYYAFTYKGVHFRGDRPWALRWESIRRAVDFRGKRLVELGCNMGLLSSFARIHGASSAQGVDYDPQLVDAAKLVALALDSGAEFERVDLASSEPWEERIGSGEIVSALSLMHWLSPDVQERVLRFLGKHREVLYEGHDPLEVETARLRRAGFTDVRVLATTERERVLLYGSR